MGPRPVFKSKKMINYNNSFLKTHTINNPVAKNGKLTYNYFV